MKALQQLGVGMVQFGPIRSCLELTPESKLVIFIRSGPVRFSGSTLASTRSTNKHTQLLNKSTSNNKHESTRSINLPPTYQSAISTNLPIYQISNRTNLPDLKPYQSTIFATNKHEGDERQRRRN
ncbi:hypothetical protein ACE6H2_023291 [Prunus campanulata]